METDLRRNPALLKLELYCRGIRIDDSCLVERDGGRPILRTRAGLGSGLELVLPGGLWTNVPVNERFARSSPYILYRENTGYVIRREGTSPRGPGPQTGPPRGEMVAPVQPASRPAWYDLRTSSGTPMSRVGTLQGTYLGIYPAKICDYWKERPRANCRFCSVGLNLGLDDASDKSVRDVLEVVRAARDESRITYVDFNTGHYDGETYLDTLEPFIRTVKAETGLLIGVQTPPHRDLGRYDALRAMGVNRVSFCFEIFDPARFREICPGKDREYGLERYLAAVKYCARRSPAAGCFDPWVTNGEVIAGLEPPASTMAAIDWITSVGAIPTVCVFRPLVGTDLEDQQPPRTEEMIPIFQRLYAACMERNLPIGVAPNVHVSLVLLPEECRMLLDRPRRYWRKELMLRAKAALFRRRFAHELLRTFATAR